jgi:hypothetical protein
MPLIRAAVTNFGCRRSFFLRYHFMHIDDALFVFYACTVDCSQVKKNRIDVFRRSYPFPASGSLKNPGKGFRFLEGQPRAHHFVNRRADYY